MSQFYAEFIASIDDLGSKSFHVNDIFWNLANFMREDKYRSPNEFQVNFLFVEIVELGSTAFYPRI